MREHHLLRISGAARGLLDEGDISRFDRRLPGGFPGPEIAHGHHGLQRLDLCLEEASDELRLANGDQNRSEATSEDRPLAPQMILELGPTFRPTRKPS